MSGLDIWTLERLDENIEDDTRVFVVCCIVLCQTVDGVYIPADEANEAKARAISGSVGSHNRCSFLIVTCRLSIFGYF